MASSSSPYLLIIGIALIVTGGLIVLSGNSVQSLSTISTTSTTSTNATTPSEIIYNGNEAGINLGTVQKMQTITITYLSGKIISNSANGYSAPIWGVPIKDTDSAWIPLMPYANEGMWTNAVYVETGTKRVSFRQGQNQLEIKNDSGQSQTYYLKFHEAKGYFSDNTGNARFQITVR